VDPETVLIDGYNVIRRTHGLAAAERHTLAAGRDALIQKVASSYRQTAHQAIVVFDGDGPRETAQPLPRCRGRVIYTRAGESADAVIQRIAGEEAHAGRIPRVHTDDMALRLAVEARGGRAASAAELTQAADAPDRFRARQARHQAFVRGQLSRADDADEGGRSGGQRVSKRRGRRR
jgi:uncharacterized protein